MKSEFHRLFMALALLALATLNSQLSTCFAQGTAFTYQGQLQNNGSPASGTYNLTFTLFNTNTSGVAIAVPVTNSAVAVTNGLFTVRIDFGPGVFTGQTNWLQIGVETNGVNTFTPLTPRQELTPTPYAIYAESANTLSGTLSASQLTSIGNTNGGFNDNFFVGPSGNATTSGGYNTANGYFALGNNTSGTFNTANGYTALSHNTSGNDNTANGADALLFNTSGSNNTANGVAALESNTSGSQNTADGAYALIDNTSGSNNVAEGYYALVNNTNGSFNTANGVEALYWNTSGSQNTADGAFALIHNTSGSNNVAEGYSALVNNTNDNDLVAIGYQALQNDNAYNQGSYSGNGENTALGYQALQLNTGGFGNTAIGYQALQPNTSGFDNTANGDYALIDNTSGAYNTAVGYGALYSNTNGSGNIGVGFLAGQDLYSGNNNIYIGNYGNFVESGVIRIGMPGTQTNTFIAGNVSIGGASPQQELNINGGMEVDAAASDNGTVNAAWTLLFGGAVGEGIGSVRVASHADSYGLNFYTDYNKRMTILQNGNVGIGTTNATQLLVVGSGGAYCNGTSWVNGSDRNSKEDFAAVNPRDVLDKVSALPITEWQYKVDASGLKHIGPMAQDFYAAFGLNGTDDKHIATVDEEGVALAAIQGLNQKLEADAKAKDAEIQTLKTQNDSLAERLNELEATVKQLAANR